MTTLRPRGPWSSTAIYDPLDLVSHDGSSYIAIVESIGRTPTDPSSTVFWMAIAERGEPGAFLNPRGIWSKTTLYEPLDVVTYDSGYGDESWLCRRSNINHPPREDDTWQVITVRVIYRTSGGGGASDVPAFVEVEDEGVPLGSATLFNFVGPGVTASMAGSTATISIPGFVLTYDSPSPSTFGDTGTVGVDPDVAHADHLHDRRDDAVLFFMGVAP